MGHERFIAGFMGSPHAHCVMQVTGQRQAVAVGQARIARIAVSIILVGSMWMELECPVHGTRLAHITHMKTACHRSVLILALLACPALAESVHEPRQLREAAEQFVLKQLGSPGNGVQSFATAGALDSRLRLAQCTQPLTAALPPNARISARVTVGVSCTQPRWTVYVPVTIETELPVLVLRDAAARGSKPSASDVEVRRMRVAGLADTYIRDIGQLADRHLKMAAAPGTPLDVELLAPDILVKRGQRVMLVVQVSGIEVRAQGEAVSDATANGRVRVLNLDSHRIVEGQVETRDRVRVSL
jgi:flagella basal body P-ring formation protein FlgA